MLCRIVKLLFAQVGHQQVQAAKLEITAEDHAQAWLRRKATEIVIETTVDSGLTDIVAGRYDAGFRRGLVARDMIATRVTNDMQVS
jgi:hypothetical protein